MNLSSYVVQERCIEIRSHLHRCCRHQRRLRRLVVQYLVDRWRYGRCIEIGPHLHRHCRHQGRLRRLSSRTGSPVALWRCIEIAPTCIATPRISGGFAALSSRMGSSMALWQMHRDRASPALPFPASVAASPPCRPARVHRWRYGRCIEIAPRLHGDRQHQGRLRRLSSSTSFASGAMTMHRDSA